MKKKKKELKTKKRRMMRTIIQKIDVVPDHFWDRWKRHDKRGNDTMIPNKRNTEWNNDFLSVTLGNKKKNYKIHLNKSKSKQKKIILNSSIPTIWN